LTFSLLLLLPAVEVSTKQCTPRLADFEALAEEDFVDSQKVTLKFLTLF
jgi:hypothetical protein